MIKPNQILNISCEDGLSQLDDCSVDMICIDPPYTDGKGKDVLKGHKIQTKIDILAVTKEHFRVLKPNCFYTVFGQMPTILAWYNAAIESGFVFQDDITWVKRHCTAIYLPIIRQKETIFIFKKGDAKYHTTKGAYEDVKLPLFLDGLTTIETIKTYISDLKRKNIKGINIDTKITKDKRKINDSQYKDYACTFNRSPTEVNFTNVWSFMPENLVSFGNDEDNTAHPTVKPTKLIQRLIELCTPDSPDVIILDSFIGSGTTYLAAQNTNRKCIGFEILKEYYDIAKQRTTDNHDLFITE